jgi:hypothetical protein
MQLAPEELIPGTTYYITDPVTKTCAPFISKKEHGPGHPDWGKIIQGKIVKMSPQSIIVVGGGPTGTYHTAMRAFAAPMSVISHCMSTD